MSTTVNIIVSSKFVVSKNTNENKKKTTEITPFSEGKPLKNARGYCDRVLGKEPRVIFFFSVFGRFMRINRLNGKIISFTSDYNKF